MKPARAAPIYSDPPTRSPWLILFMLVIPLAGVVGFGAYYITATPIDLQIGEQHSSLRTRAVTVRAVLSESGVYIEPEDRVQPALETPIKAGMLITVEKAHPVILLIDGREQRLLTHQTDPKAILERAGVTVDARDSVSVEGSTITLRRARSFTLDDNGSKRVLYTTAETVAAALSDSQVALFAADSVRPALNAPLAETVIITRSIPILIQVDGRLFQTRTQGKTVAAALTDTGIGLVGLDSSTPGLNTAITPNLTIRITRITESEEIERVELPFERFLTPDPALPLDEVRLIQPGRLGAQETHIRVRREDGVEVSRSAPLKWITHPPTDELGQIGTTPVLKKLETPGGALEYWRALTVTAKSYRPSTGGKLPSDPTFGVTSTGQRLVKGIIAVDPKLIPLGTEVYIPNYGRATAGDAPNTLTGLTIKLGYDDGDYQAFDGTVTVYLLAPIPPGDQIAPLPVKGD